MSANHKRIERVAIVPHLGKQKVAEIARELIAWLEGKGIGIALSMEDAEKLDRPSCGQPFEEYPDADLVVSLGGDGTILRSVRLLKGRPIPVLGVNLGTLGFLSAVEVGELYPEMERILEGNYEVDERIMLECRISFASGSEARQLALNEVVVERGERQRMIRIDVSINDAFFNRFTADGLILATPTGSTAYSFSAGGPVVVPSNEVVVLTPISPHSLFGRPVVIHPNDTVKISITEEIGTSVGIDGIVVAKNALIRHITVDRAEEKALLVKSRQGDFYATFRKKLCFWDSWNEAT